ncbi:unnamed protein product [Ranitomeya imitator]|uniref:Reverse transcriptase/retrotransposon-derived protein RNase H-like domain-containing protein n=1 Tax=Ranitomeya imitator TaxID=111125 RepID=A0ABN9M3V8_9NEOB|nr:unnamed protein product [Ranitomeya imitator]
MKNALCKQPVLMAPNFKKEFILQTDASDVGVGAVLSQELHGEEHPVLYLSRKLSSSEKNYSVVEKECLAIKWAVDTLRYYLLGRKFRLVSDHAPLRASITEPPTANIKPTPVVATPSKVTTTQRPPRASIRPMVTPAVVSTPTTTPTATVMPTTQVETQEGTYPAVLTCNLLISLHLSSLPFFWQYLLKDPVQCKTMQSEGLLEHVPVFGSTSGSVRSTSPNVQSSLSQSVPAVQQQTAFVQPTQQSHATIEPCTPEPAVEVVQSSPIERPSTSSSVFTTSTPSSSISKRQREEEESSVEPSEQSMEEPDLPVNKKLRTLQRVEPEEEVLGEDIPEAESHSFDQESQDTLTQISPRCYLKEKKKTLDYTHPGAVPLLVRLDGCLWSAAAPPIFITRRLLLIFSSGAGVLRSALLRADKVLQCAGAGPLTFPAPAHCSTILCPQEGRAKYACAGAVAEDQKRTSCNEDGRCHSGRETPIRPDQQRDRPWSASLEYPQIHDGEESLPPVLDNSAQALEPAQSVQSSQDAVTKRDDVIVIESDEEEEEEDENEADQEDIQGYDDEEEDEDDDGGMGEEGDESNGEDGSADGNDTYEGEEAAGPEGTDPGTETEESMSTGDIGQRPADSQNSGEASTGTSESSLSQEAREQPSSASDRPGPRPPQSPRRPPHPLPPRLTIHAPPQELGPPAQRISMARRQSVGRGLQLTPGLGGMQHFFDDEDRTVPSTPTLVVPHRTDGFAEAIHSPQVAGVPRFRFGPPEDMPQASSSHSDLGQLASQGGLGMYETPLFLAHEEESGGRSVPTTPLQSLFLLRILLLTTSDHASQSVPMVTTSTGNISTAVESGTADEGDEVFVEGESEGIASESTIEMETRQDQDTAQPSETDLPSTSQDPPTSSSADTSTSQSKPLRRVRLHPQTGDLLSGERQFTRQRGLLNRIKK